MATQQARLPGEITIAYEEIGEPDHPPLLLVGGLGQQLIAWRDDFVAELTARGLRVIRFDNRDTGLSTHFEEMPDLEAMFGGDRSSAPYTLSDMASDAAGLIEALGLDSAHVAGVSMGGMVAQVLAAEHPQRVRSLVSIMSTTGERSVSQPTPEAQAVLLGPRSTNVEEAQQRAVEFARVVGSPGMLDEDWSRELARRSFERAFDPAGLARHLAAIWAVGDRTEAVRTIAAPTLVMHGELDPLMPLSAGRATADAIEGSELLVLEGMAHDVPRRLWPRIADAIAGHAHAAEQGRRERAA